MCCGGCSDCGCFPSPLGLLISQLKPGDQVIVLKGEGMPPVAEDTLCIIVAVDGFSALTAEGVALNRRCVSDLVLTGNNFSDYEISPEAQAILNEIAAIKAEEKSYWDQESDTTDIPNPSSSIKPARPAKELGPDPLELL